MTLNGPYSSKAGNPTAIASTVTTVPVTDGNSTANIEVSQYERTFPTAIFDQEHLGRIDYQMTPKDRFYLRYNYQNNPYNPAFLPGERGDCGRRGISECQRHQPRSGRGLDPHVYFEPHQPA